MTVFYDGFVRNDRLNARAKRVIGLGRWYYFATDDIGEMLFHPFGRHVLSQKRIVAGLISDQ
jgi:hypothetical protein